MMLSVTDEAGRDAEQLPRPGLQWGGVIDGVYQLDVRKTFVRLVTELKLDDTHWQYGEFLRAANEADHNAYDATRLARAAKVEEGKLRDDTDQQLAVMRESARKELEAEKAAGTRSKAPTKDDITDRARTKWPDRHRKLNAEMARMHGATRTMEGLERSWRSRCQTLQAMLRGRR